MNKLDVETKYQITYCSAMNFRLFRILTIILSFFFLTGFVPLSFVGPGVTVLTSGNVYKASAQFIVNQYIEKETGKNSFALIKDTLLSEETDKKIKINSFDEDLRQLVETRIKMTRQKLDNQNLQKLLKKRIEVTRSILYINNTTK